MSLGGQGHQVRDLVSYGEKVVSEVTLTRVFALLRDTAGQG